MERWISQTSRSASHLSQHDVFLPLLRRNGTPCTFWPPTQPASAAVRCTQHALGLQDSHGPAPVPRHLLWFIEKARWFMVQSSHNEVVLFHCLDLPDPAATPGQVWEMHANHTLKRCLNSQAWPREPRAFNKINFQQQGEYWWECGAGDETWPPEREIGP